MLRRSDPQIISDEQDAAAHIFAQVTRTCGQCGGQAIYDVEILNGRAVVDGECVGPCGASWRLMAG